MKYSEYLEQTERFPKIGAGGSSRMPNCDVVMRHGEVIGLKRLLRKYNLDTSGEWVELPWLQLALYLARDHVADFPSENRGRDEEGHFKFWAWVEVEIIKRSDTRHTNESAFLELSNQTERDHEFRSVNAIKTAYYRFKREYNPDADKQGFDKIIDSHLCYYSSWHIHFPPW